MKTPMRRKKPEQAPSEDRAVAPPAGAPEVVAYDKVKWHEESAPSALRCAWHMGLYLSFAARRGWLAENLGRSAQRMKDDPVHAARVIARTLGGLYSDSFTPEGAAFTGACYPTLFDFFALGEAEAYETAPTKELVDSLQAWLDPLYDAWVAGGPPASSPSVPRRYVRTPARAVGPAAAGQRLGRGPRARTGRND
jgi:hypothetical protein